MKREFEGEEVGEIKKPKLPKKRVAILLGYIGTNYCGLQFQLGKNSTPSIEETVFESLVKVGGVSQENSDDIRKVGWFRASRTDKGVHALMNIVTLKVTFQDDMIKKLNETLPKDIMVHDILRVTNSFNPKKNCEFRVYEFILPTYCLEKNDKWKDFRITKERLEKVQNLLNHYVGTVSFHNFTKKESESKDYYRRIIKSYNVSEPRMIQDYECVSLIVNVMIHQIRKMIGLIIWISFEYIDEKIFETIFNQDVEFITPKAPGIGLMLNHLNFENYNKKYGKIHGNILFDKYQQGMDDLKLKIANHLVEQEEKDKIFKNWIESKKTY